MIFIIGPVLDILENEARAQDNKFTDEQINYLIEKVSQARKLSFKPWAVKRSSTIFKDIVKDYCRNFERWGGNTERLGKRMDSINPIEKAKTTIKDAEKKLRLR